MTAIAMAADVPSTGCVPGATAIRLPLGKAPGGMSSEQFYDAITALLEREQTVICIYPSWRARRAEHDITLVRTLLNSERVVGVKSDLPPLALSLTADILVHLAQYVPPGVLVAMVGRLANQVTAGAWLRSVTKFQHAPASLSNHVRSYLPGSAFTAVVSPEAAVKAAKKGKVLGWRPTDPVHLLVAGENVNEDWVRQKLAPEVRPTVLQQLPAQPTAGAYWGTKQATEFVAFSAHPDALTSAVRQVRYRPCSWCGELVPGDPCPFCHMSAQIAMFQPSHTLPANQQLPSTPLAATDNGLSAASTTSPE